MNAGYDSHQHHWMFSARLRNVLDSSGRGGESTGAHVDWKRRTVRADDGAELTVWTADPTGSSSTDVPMLLVHGFSLDHTTWRPMAELLVARGVRVIAPDLRGHGQSALGTIPPTLDRMVADLVNILDDLGVPTVHLVGHSLGAVVALAGRVDDQLGPRLASVTSIAGTEQAVQNPVMRLGARLFSSSLGVSALSRRQPGRLMISTWFGKAPATADLDWIRELSARCEPATRAAITSATDDVDLRPTFDMAGPPTMVIGGRRDRAAPPKISERIAGAISGAELRLIDDAGHMVIIERPAQVTDRLIEWTARRR